ncbi:CIC11C00000005867 [Sungouiella intermedia]|uniref:CIC11C00000005867 n=1 Tax=Sungouiella intermedia TaxID=45354 RepID=A0A1L0DK03_9ASCO|nr:CIC11C00000005867 [[Candida] intermedia]
MFTKSATPATPVTRPKSHINESVRWVKEWYSPLEYSTGAAPNLKLKGWVKKTGADQDDAIAISSDVLNLEKAKYLKEPVVSEEVVEEKPVDENANSDLKLALSMDKKEDQISSLSGLGM